MRSILVSIIVPVYNVEEYLDDCVNSILSQSHKTIQVILVDDGSTDNSGLLCDNYVRKDSRVETIHKKNGGLSSARNAGIKLAKGEYIAFIDSDDAISKYYVERLLTITKETDADISLCGISKGEQLTLDKFTYTTDIPKVFTHDRLYKDFYLDVNDVMITVAWNKLYRASIVKDLYFPEGYNNEDMRYTPIALDRATRIAVTQDKLIFYRIRPGSIQTSCFNPKKLHIIEAFRFQKEFFREKDEHIFYRALGGFISQNIRMLGQIKKDGRNKYIKEMEYINSNLSEYTWYYVCNIPIKVSTKFRFIVYSIKRALGWC